MFVIRYLFERALFAYFYLKDGKMDIDIDENREPLYIAIIAFLFGIVGSMIAVIYRTLSDLGKCEYNGKLVILATAILTVFLYKYYKYVKLVDVAKSKYDRIPDSDRKRNVVYWRIIAFVVSFFMPIAFILSAILRRFVMN